MIRIFTIALAVVFLTTFSVAAEEDQALSVAVLGFSTTGEDGFRIVNRSELTRTIGEQGLNLAGVTDTQQATKAGKVVGAKLLVTGKAFGLGQSRVFTTMLIETELKVLLISAGADVRDIKDNALADWVKDFEEGGNPSWPRSLEGVEMIIFADRATVRGVDLAEGIAGKTALEKAGRVIGQRLLPFLADNTPTTNAQ